MNRLLARNYAPEQLKLAVRLEDPDEAADTHEIEQIIGHRTTEGGETLYMVKWKGYDNSHNKELPYENFNSKSIIARYHRKLNQPNPHSQNRPPNTVFIPVARQSASTPNRKTRATKS